MPLLAAALAVATVMSPPQRFSVRVDAVRVDVLVTDGNRPVTGLTAADFELRDNGVTQRIQSVALEDVPLSLTLALDVSASVKGQPLVHLKQAASELVRLMAPDDRAALLSFSGALTLSAPWTSDHHRLDAAISSTKESGATSLHDAAYAALTLKDDQPGRGLVLIFSDGDDTSGWLNGQAVIDAARRNDAVVYAVVLRDASQTAAGFRVDFRSGTQPPIPNVPAPLLMEPFLKALAEDTGGTYIDAGRSDRLQATFTQIVKEFRSRYLLTYAPTGVNGPGWHALEVKVKNKPGRTQARRGYLR